MVDVRRFQITEAATEKLGRRGISVADAQQLIDNSKLLRPNVGRRHRTTQDFGGASCLGAPTVFAP